MDVKTSPAKEYEIHGGFSQETIASKYDELDDNIPPVKDFLRASKSRAAAAFEYSDVVAHEATLLRRLEWDLMVLTPLHFVHSLAGMGVLFESDRLTPSEDEARA